MKPKFAILLAATTLTSQADIFTLKNGQKLDGEIVERSLEEYVLEVNVTGSIKERRTIKRSDIVDHKIVSAATTEFEKIKDLAPVPAYTSLDEYDRRITALNKFLEKYKVSSAGTKALKMLKELQDEQQLISAGGLKTPDGMITAEERLADAITYDSQVSLAQFQNAVKAKNYTAALRAYRTLSTDTFGSAAHRKALPTAEKVVATYSNALKRELNTFDTRENQRLDNIDRLSDADRARIEADDRRRLAAFAKLIAEEEKQGIHWTSIHPRDPESMEIILDRLQDKAASFTQVKRLLEEIPETGEIYRKGLEAAAAGREKIEETEDAIYNLEQAKVADSYIDRIVAKYREVTGQNEDGQNDEENQKPNPEGE